MRVRTVYATLVYATLAVSTLWSATPAHADFRTALGEYNAGHYELAHTQFMALAELGDCSSQYNLGTMALEGQGGPKDAGRGVGWLQAAAGNGCEQMVGTRLAGLTEKLSAEDSRAAAGIVARYGREALRTQGVVSPDFRCREQAIASVVQAPVPEYPHLAGVTRPSAFVITELTIGVDGLARDPDILLAVPEKAFAAAAVQSWLNSRFVPASRGGTSIESRVQVRSLFDRWGGGVSGMDVYKASRQRADAGDPGAEYLVGLTALVDASLGISYARAGELLIGSAREGDARAQYWVGSQLRAAALCRSHKNGAVWLRHAADGGSASAQLMLATDLLDGEPSAAQAAEARSLLERAATSDSFYVRKHVVALLAASPLDAVRDPGAALAVAMKLAAGEIQSDPQMFEAVGAAYAANGDFGRASAQQQTAIGKARSLAWNTRVMTQRLSAYRDGKPWRGDLLALPPAGSQAN
jgi:TPR repeat protein